MKGFKDKNKKFHPITTYKGVRKRKEQPKEPFKVEEPDGVKIPQGKLIQMQKDAGFRGKRYAHQEMEMHHDLPIDMAVREQMEWEHVVGSEIVKVKHEIMDGRPVTSVRFANGEEWFEFDSIDHQEEFIKENEIEVDDSVTGEFVEVDHPIIAGYITMSSGKIAFGEKEDVRKKRDVTLQITHYDDPSHGFYKVPNSLLRELGIQDKITNYSKRQADFTFLEEDQDATTFFNALKKKGIEFDIDDINQKYFDSANENPASPDFRLCDQCGITLGSIEALKRHKGKFHNGS